MDFIEAKDTFVVEECDIPGTGQTSDNFQKFIYELFAKNGIINDLRAYLRGHIVNVLKNAETGDLPACQKHFAQRLELPLQALNILIVEYLLTMEFNYTSSVFISEIPLANMVFEFTKVLLNLNTQAKMPNLQFEDGDVWSILNYIGVKSSSEHALKIVEIYKSEKQPLLWCILKCVSMYQKEEDQISNPSTITQSSDTLGKRTPGSHKHIFNCKHSVYCKACHNRVTRLKEKYKRKKAMMEEKKRSSVKKLNLETFMNKVSGLEQSLIDEMFLQMKVAYEAELELVKEEQRKKVKRSIASHALQLQKYREKMEQSFKARESELSKAIQQKKRFLWGLARSLRDQHAHLTSAMTDVRRHTERLTNQESNIKTQLEEAEQTLKKRGEDMRNQISEELVIMEGHLEKIKRERDRINEERKEIENIKNNDTPVEKVLEPQYDFIKTELSILRKHIEAMNAEPKCVIEGGGVSDIGNKCFMNNENIGIKKEKQETNRVINDLKKLNNIHFSQSNIDDINTIVTECRPSTVSSVGDSGAMRDHTRDIRDGDFVDEAILDFDKTYIQDTHLRVGSIQDGVPADTRVSWRDMDTLRQENGRLKEFARQQREYIQALLYEKDKLQRVLNDRSRPRTAPPGTPYWRGHRDISDPRWFCLQGSAGGSEAPETRRWWTRRASGTTLPPHATKDVESNVPFDDTDIRRAREIFQNTSKLTQRPSPQTDSEKKQVAGVREKSHKLCLTEIREKLRSRMVKQHSHQDNSSDALLREARRRLRKLEIEAEAVEKSYRDYRKRRRELTEERENRTRDGDTFMEKIYSSDVKHKPFENYENEAIEKNSPLTFPKESSEAMKNDFDKYFKEYTAKLHFNQLRFSNKNSIIKNVKPIPAPLTNREEVNYLETPLIEFRKLYQGQRTARNKRVARDVRTEKDNSELIIKRGNGANLINNHQNKKELHDDFIKSPTTESDTNNFNNNVITQKVDNNKTNLLLVEVENGCENVVVPEENEGVLIVVESSVDNRDVSDDDGRTLSPQISILVSPRNKRASKDPESLVDRSRSASPPHSTQVCSLKPIFRTDNKEVSSVDLQLELSISEEERNRDDYLDDFSADVDNYNSPYECDNKSPISLPKTTEDETF